MSGTRRDEHPREQDAEIVRAYLVELRGGAPFLSSRDGRLLLVWMDSDVPVALICQALEELSELKLEDSALERVVEEVARDLLRQQHPLLSASTIWDTVRA